MKYTLPILWKRKHDEEIREAKKMSLAEKFDIMLQLNIVGLELMEVNNREKKLKFHQEILKVNRERLKDFINEQLRI
ncbi:MAG: hypothetical protein QME07_00100 [bacterium]|nr:hypothetical protein [bacterium]